MASGQEAVNAVDHGDIKTKFCARWRANRRDSIRYAGRNKPQYRIQRTKLRPL